MHFVVVVSSKVFSISRLHLFRVVDHRRSVFIFIIGSQKLTREAQARVSRRSVKESPCNHKINYI